MASETSKKTLRPAHNTGTIKTTVPDWTVADGFRENVQNWKDAIIQSNSIKDPRNFNTVIFDRRKLGSRTARSDIPEDVIMEVKAYGEDHTKVLGCIRYHAKTKDHGWIEMINFDFAGGINEDYLFIGSSGKRAQKNQVGQHGEGLKLAALVMLRNGYNTMTITDDREWDWYFGGQRDELKISFRPAKRVALRENMDTVPWGLRKDDVSIELGRIRKGGAKHIAESEFRKWLLVSIDLAKPTDICQTNISDILHGSESASCLYLKGLKLSMWSGRGLRYRLGYNILLGRTDRDRRFLEDPEPNGKNVMDYQMASIYSLWTAAIRQQGSEPSEWSAIAEYCKLLREADDRNPPLDVQNAYRLMDESVAVEIWKHLRSNDSECFYYASKDEDGVKKDFNEMVEDVAVLGKKTAQPVNKSLWAILRKFPALNCRNLQEERRPRSKTSPIFHVPEVPFARHVSCVLSQALKLHSATNQISVSYVDAGDLPLGCWYTADESLLQVHARYLDISQAHKYHACPRWNVMKKNKLPDDVKDVFTCDHIIDELLATIYPEILTGDRKAAGKAAMMLTKARTTHCNMPRQVRLESADQSQQLRVSWKLRDDRLEREILKGSMTTKVLVELICAEACEDEEAHSMLCKNTSARECGCPPPQVVRGRVKTITFCNLDPDVSYKARVRRLLSETAMYLDSIASLRPLREARPTTGVARAAPAAPAAKSTLILGSELTHSSLYEKVLSKGNYPTGWRYFDLQKRNNTESTSGIAIIPHSYGTPDPQSFGSSQDDSEPNSDVESGSDMDADKTDGFHQDDDDSPIPEYPPSPPRKRKRGVTKQTVRNRSSDDEEPRIYTKAARKARTKARVAVKSPMSIP